MLLKIVRSKLLYCLVRESVGNPPMDGKGCALQKVTSEDWSKAIDLSFQQGVAAIAVDGLQKLYESCPNLELELDKPEYEALKYEWFGSVFQAETDFSAYLSAAKSLAKLYADNGVKTLVLKGLVFSDCYPVPSHRSSCDLDCYLTGDYEKGNQLVEQNGEEVNRNYFKNSSFNYKGLHVENHHFFTAFLLNNSFCLLYIGSNA